MPLGQTWAGTPFQTESLKLFGQMVDTPTAARKREIDALIVGLKNGGVWTELDGLAIFAAHSKQAALLNWVTPGKFDFTEAVAPTFATDQGYTGNGTSQYLESGYNLSSSGGQFTQNSSSIFAWCNTTAQDSKPIIGVNSSAGGTGAYIYPRFTDDNCYYRMQSSPEDSFANTDGKGFYSVSRRGSASLEAYKNGASSGTATRTSSALENTTLTVLVYGSNYFSGQCMCAGWGDQLSTAQHLALYNAVHAYLQIVAGIA